MSNGTIWNIRCSPNCNSINVLYFLVCLFCNYESYIGKTDDARDRTNNHISGCRHGNTTDIFDNHVYRCGHLDIAPEDKKKAMEPYFKLYIMLECSSYHRLLDYEKKFHAAGMDTMNKPHQEECDFFSSSGGKEKKQNRDIGFEVLCVCCKQSDKLVYP